MFPVNHMEQNRWLLTDGECKECKKLFKNIVRDPKNAFH